jgi:L-asparagine transporter-like permease
MLVALAWIVGVMISPDALVLHGTTAAAGGWLYAAALAAALALHSLSSGGPHSPDREIALLSSTWGRFAATALLITARPAVAVCVATAVLVTAGFAVNETLLYWFPNFLAAAILLLLVLSVNLGGPRIAAAAQILFSGVAVGGLLVLILAGLLEWKTPPVIDWAARPHRGVDLLLPALLFVGYELLAYAPVGTGDRLRMHKAIWSALVAVGLLFLVWNALSWVWVPQDRLATTHIPHILTARAVAGETGRMMIAVVIIAGACAAVNFLFYTVSHMLARMATAGLLPAWLGVPVVPLFVLAGATALLMIFGFAGSALLEVAIRAGLLLWILLYGLLHAARTIQLTRQPNTRLGKDLPLRHGLLSVAMLAVASGLAILYPGNSMLLYTMAVLLTVAAVIAGLARLTARDASPRLGIPRELPSFKKGEHP